MSLADVDDPHDHVDHQHVDHVHVDHVHDVAPSVSAPLAWYRRIPAWVGPAVVGGLAATACAYTYMVNPNTESGILPPCYFRQVTGLDCPGCGLTRSAYALMHGDPARALDHNILAAIIFPLMLYAYIAWSANSVGIRLPQIKVRAWMGWAGVAILGGFWVVRNLPPFAYLRSTA